MKVIIYVTGQAGDENENGEFCSSKDLFIGEKFEGIKLVVVEYKDNTIDRCFPSMNFYR